MLQPQLNVRMSKVDNSKFHLEISSKKPHLGPPLDLSVYGLRYSEMRANDKISWDLFLRFRTICGIGFARNSPNILN